MRTVLAALVVVAGVVGLGAATPVRPPATPTVSLGPDQGAPVADVLAAAGTALAAVPADDPRWALVSLTAGLTPAAAAPLLGDVRVSRVLLHLALDRVQTAVVAVDTAGQRAPQVVLDDAASRAAATQAAAASTSPRRAGATAAAEAAGLRAGCACVVGVVVRGDGRGRRELARAAGVRSVDPAPAGTSWGSLAVRPLLPEQTGVVGPGPDDGPVPP
ncbi:hypothetical protein [Rhodococcus aerolatus]